MMMADVIRQTKDAQAFTEPLLTALEHIEKRGSLLSLVPDRRQRLGLMKALTQQKLMKRKPPVFRPGALRTRLQG
jgi:hypothetical protein